MNLIPASCEQALLCEQVAACPRQNVPAMVLFRDVDRDLVRHLKAEGVQVIHQVGSGKDAEAALARFSATR